MSRLIATLALTLALLTPSLADAAPRRKAHADDTAELASLKGQVKLATHRVKLAKAQAAYAKAAKRLAHEQAIADCIAERTGPTDGIPADEAVEICVAEAE